MAKGVEDTAFYVYNRLVSLNDVGGMPGRFGTPLEVFHGQNLERLKTFPHAMISTATHDSKRGEDVRARIDVLSEMPDAWQKALVKWSRLNSKKGVVLDGQTVPTRNEEYLLYQTLLGAWPFGEMDQAGFHDLHDSATGMATWPAQTLVLINEKAASTADLLAFKQQIVDAVQAKFGITLEQEPELLP